MKPADDYELLTRRELTHAKVVRVFLGIWAVVTTVTTLWAHSAYLHKTRELDTYRACYTWALEGYVIAPPSNCLIFNPAEWWKYVARKP